jgi:hypothetical protein
MLETAGGRIILFAAHVPMDLAKQFRRAVKMPLMLVRNG